MTAQSLALSSPSLMLGTILWQYDSNKNKKAQKIWVIKIPAFGGVCDVYLYTLLG